MVQAVLPSIDSSSPYFLHHSDHPGLVLVSQPLTSENYNTWSRSMRMALTAKSKIGFIDGTITKPDDKSDPSYSNWERCNTMIFSWILNSVSQEIAASVIYADSVLEVWVDLKERFSQINGPRIYEIQRSISECNQDQNSVTTYFTKLKALWDELSSHRPMPSCSCGASKSAYEYILEDRTTKFLMGLNDSYAGIRGQILLMSPIPNISRTFSLVLQEERQRTIVAGRTPLLSEFAAFMTKSGSNTNFRDGKDSRFQKKHGYTKHERPKCDHCGWNGHTIDKCFKLHGYPSGVAAKREGNQPMTQIGRSSEVSKVNTSAPFPFTQAQCQQLLHLLNNNNASANQVGIAPTSTTLSGPVLDDDDWTG